jgi:hypothetical protein
MRMPFEGKIVERDGNNRERCDYLDTVEEFSKVSHMVFYEGVLLLVRPL